MRALARELLDGIAGQLNFYGELAAEDLGQPLDAAGPARAADRRRARRPRAATPA